MRAVIRDNFDNRGSPGDRIDALHHVILSLDEIAPFPTSAFENPIVVLARTRLTGRPYRPITIIGYLGAQSVDVVNRSELILPKDPRENHKKNRPHFLSVKCG